MAEPSAEPPKAEEGTMAAMEAEIDQTFHLVIGGKSISRQTFMAMMFTVMGGTFVLTILAAAGTAAAGPSEPILPSTSAAPSRAPPPPTPSCPPGYLGFGVSCYFFSHHKASWADARDQCVEYGGALATIESQEEDDFIANHLLTELVANDDYWIGLNDVDTGENIGPFSWTSGVAYTGLPAEGNSYSHWLDGEPNNAANGLGRGDCVRICPAGGSWGYATAGGCPGGYWGDFYCKSEQHYVCEMSPAAALTLPTRPVCPPEFITGPNGNCYFFSYDLANYADAENACTGLGGVLACVQDQQEDEFIRDHLVTRKTGNVDYWIGYHDRGAESEFAWSGGCHSTYENWFVDEASGTYEPNNQGYGVNNDCVRMCPAETNGNHNLADGTAVTCTPGAWADFDCAREYGYVCEVTPFSVNPAPPRFAIEPPCPEGYRLFNGNCYLFSSSKARYADAEHACERLNGTLATIEDQRENDFVTEHLTAVIGGNDDYWIGFHDRGTEMNFEWSGGQTSSYTNWQQCTVDQQCTSEPNGAGGNGESVGDCVRMCPAGGSTGKYGECIPGKWADYMCEAEFHYICEMADMVAPLPATRCPRGYISYRAHCYYFAHYPASWEDASSTCNSLGGALATINSQEEDDFIANHLSTELTGNLDYWIGLNDVDTGENIGPFSWADGETTYTEGNSYSHWLTGEPNNAANGLGRGDCVRICPAGESWGYATAGGCPGGYWGDFLCDYELPYVCEMRPFPPPHEPPAPAPCPQNYIAQGENCYFFSYDVANYADAEDACQTLGGVLSCIMDQQEDDFIRDHLVSRVAGNLDYWIGYHDRGAEAQFAWSGGCRSTYEHWFVDPQGRIVEPNNEDADGTEGDCVRMCPAETNGNHNADDGTAIVCTPGAWADFGCEQPNAYVCEVPRAGAEPAPHRPSLAPPCPVGFLLFPDPLNPGISTCYLFSLARSTWPDASLYCEFIGGRLADIESEEEDNFLKAHEVHIVNTLDQYWIGIHDDHGSLAWEGATGLHPYSIDYPSSPWLVADSSNMLTKNHYVCEVQYNADGNAVFAGR